MKREPISGIQPSILRWARQSMGLSVPDVAHALKKPASAIEAWEGGTDAPTYVELEKLAYAVYKRPLAIFFLPSPPVEVPPIREFRTLPDTDLASLAADTHLHIRRAHAYQLALRELFDRPPNERNIWRSLGLTVHASLPAQAQAVRDYLGITLERQTAWRSDELALKHWRESVENAGVFVFKAAFRQKDVSGFCLMDQNFPLIYLNNSTTKTRQTFSLLHELAHLLLSMNGLSKFDTRYVDRLAPPERRVEQFCNGIAAEMLMPAEDFAAQTARFPAEVERATEQQFAELATRYAVSREVVLRRFLDQGQVSKSFYEQKAKQWAAQRKATKGGDWYASQNAYLSERFAQEVVRRHYRNQLSLEQASEFLGIKPKNFAGLEQRILQGADA